MKKLYAIFGGTFDPIHYGHINAAKNLSKEICIKKIILLPNNNPPHKTKKTSMLDKLNMIKLAIKNDDLFQISYLESKNNQIFYTINTLKKLRKKLGKSQPLSFIIGTDQLNQFHLWKRWKEILGFTHLLICPRMTLKKKLSTKKMD